MNEKIIADIIKNSLSDLYLRTDSVIPEEIQIENTTDCHFLNLTDSMTKVFLFEGEERKRIGTVSSIFNCLNANAQQKRWPSVGLTKRDEVIYPGESSHKWRFEAYQDLQDWLVQEIRSFRNDKKWINAFFDGLEEKLLYVPDELGNDEVSLYEHAKFAVALGNCCWEFYKKEERNFSEVLWQDAQAEKIFQLFSMDLSGIQDFIYTVSSKGALKSLRARSFYLEIMMEHMVDELLDAVDLTRANLIYSGGGHCYILFPNTEETKRQISCYMEKINQWFFEKFQIDLYIGYGVVPCSLRELTNQPEGAYAELFRKISLQISMKKMHCYSMEQIVLLNGNSEGDGVRECKVCKRTDRLDQDDLCEICGSLLRFSREILTQQYFSVVKGENLDGLPLPNGKYLVSGYRKDSVRIYQKNQSDAQHICTKIWLGDYAGASTFEELADGAEGIRRLGVYRADVDNLGTAFVKGFEKPSLIRTASLSRHLSLFFKYDINTILRGKKVAVVYSGGDDLFLVGAWNDIIQSARDIQESLQQYAQQTLTISGGIGIYPDTYPINVMAKEVAELEDASKGMPEKNSITLFSQNHTFGWDVLNQKIIGEKLTLLNDYFSMTEVHGKNFLYHLLELLEKYRGADGDQINQVRYVYLLSRMEPDRTNGKQERVAYQKFSEKMYTWMQNPEDRQQLIMAIYLYVYQVREREETDGRKEEIK